MARFADLRIFWGLLFFFSSRSKSILFLGQKALRAILQLFPSCCGRGPVVLYADFQLVFWVTVLCLPILLWLALKGTLVNGSSWASLGIHSSCIRLAAGASRLVSFIPMCMWLSAQRDYKVVRDFWASGARHNTLLGPGSLHVCQ